MLPRASRQRTSAFPRASTRRDGARAVFATQMEEPAATGITAATASVATVTRDRIPTGIPRRSRYSLLDGATLRGCFRSRALKENLQTELFERSLAWDKRRASLKVGNARARGSYMRKSFAAVLAATALLAVAASTTAAAAGGPPMQPLVPASNSSGAQSPLTLAQLQQLIAELLGQSTPNIVQLQQVLTLLQELQSSQTQLQGLLTQLTTLANSLPAGALKTTVTQLISTLQSFLQPSQQLASLITQLQTLVGQTPEPATQIKQVLQQIQQLLQPSQAQLTQLLSQLQQLFQLVVPAQLLQLLRQLFPELIDIGTNGKVTLCHKTGSKKQPYHKITVSQNALPAHMRHGDLPSVAGVPCPTQVVAATNTHGKDKDKHGKGKGKGKKK